MQTLRHPPTNHRAKRIWIWTVISVLILFFFGVGVHGIHLVNPHSIEKAIDQNLGPQSDATDVRHFMETHHILYTGYMPDPPRMFGKIYKSSIGFMKGHILVEFDFNKDGKLASHRVVEHFEFLSE